MGPIKNNYKKKTLNGDGNFDFGFFCHTKPNQWKSLVDEEKPSAESVLKPFSDFQSKGSEKKNSVQLGKKKNRGEVIANSSRPKKKEQVGKRRKIEWVVARLKTKNWWNRVKSSAVSTHCQQGSGRIETR